MLRRTYFYLLFISIFALIMVNSCSGLTTSANLEPRLKQSDEFINGEKYIHRLNPLNHNVDVKASNGGGNWTFMVYLDADTNLEPFYIDTFLNISSVGSTSQVKIVVQMDRRSGYDSRFGDWTDCKRFNVTQGLTPTPENAMEDLGEVNMGDPDTLTDFVNWTVNSFPADSYCLVLMNHGSGSVAGVCFDDTSGGDALSLPELSQALSAILPEKMNVLYFDACLMGMVEVAYQIRDYADIMVASEEVGYAGQPYDYYLADLTANPSMSPSELADVIVSNYIDYTSAKLYPSTMSAVDLSQISSLKTAVDVFAQSLSDSEGSYNDKIRMARGQAEGYEGPYAGMYGWYMDLYHFAQLIYQYIPDANIRDDANQVMTLLSNAVIVEGQYHHTNSHGLSIFFPCKSESNYNDFMNEYLTADFADDTMWDEFIDYHVSITPAKPDFVVVDVYWEPSDPMPGEEVTFYADLANQGTQDANDVYLRAYKDGYFYASGTSDFPAGALENIFVTSTWTATAGNHNITWIMDPNGDIDEWNETNNEMTRNFTVGYALTVQTPYSGITVKIDGYSYATLPDGSYQKYVGPGTHSVEVQDPIALGTGTRGKFMHWNDGNPSNPRDVSVENDLTLTATYVTQYFLTVDRNPSYVGAASGEGWYDQGSTAVATCTSPVPMTSSYRYVFVNWTGDAYGTSTTLQILMDNYKTVMANYWVQYNVTFKQSGSGGLPHVTVDGTEYQLPHSLWLDEDSSHTFSYESPVSGDLGVQYVLSYTSPYTSPFTVSYARNVTGYYTTQFYITITSAHGTPTPSRWVNEGYSLAVSVQSPAETVTDQTRWRCTGFSVDQAPTQSGTSYEFYNIQEPHEIEFNWIQQFWLQVTTSVSGVTVPGTGWHDSGTSVTCNAPTASGYTFDHWIIDGASQQKGFNSITVAMNAPHEVTAQYVVASIPDSGGDSGEDSDGGGDSGPDSTDFVKPSIGEATHQPHEPDGPMPSESVTVSVDVTDDLSGVAQVILHYRQSTGGSWIEVDMSKLSGDTYVGKIPGFDLGTKVYYYVTAYDNAGNQAAQDKAGEYYSYSVIPEFSDFIIVGLFMLLTLVAVALAKIRHKATSNVEKVSHLTCKSSSKTCCHQNVA
jgi:hypothetical protein